MRLVKMSICVAALAMVAGTVSAQEEHHMPVSLPSNTLSTSHFSIVFPENWQAKRITKGMVSASSQPDATPQASADIYYYVLPAKASPRATKRFHERQKKHSVKSYIDKREAKVAKWKSKFTKASLDNNIRVEQFDMEIMQRSPAYKKKKTPVCRFFRLYHTPTAEVHITYSERGKCASSKGGFDKFISGLKWQ